MVNGQPMNPAESYMNHGDTSGRLSGQKCQDVPDKVPT